MALTAHNVLQAARQTAFGTPVATATAKLQGVTTFRINPELQGRIVNELRGSLAPGFTVVLDGYRAAATFETEVETYTDINYWLDSLMSAVNSTGAGPYTREYAAPLTAAAVPKFMTLQYGQSGSVFQIEDTSVATLTISGDSNGSLVVGGSLLGSRAVPGAIQALSDRTGLTAIMGCHASLYIDAFGSTIGTTEVSTSAFAWNLTINTNREYRGYLGDCYPTNWADQKWTGQLTLSLEHNTTTDDYVNAIVADPNAVVGKAIRIKYLTGTGSTLRTFQVDFTGKTVQAPGLFEDRNGVVAYDLVLDGVYDSHLANWLKVTTVCGTQTMS